MGVLHLGQLGIGGHEIDARGQQRQIFDVGTAKYHLLGTLFAHDTFVNAVEVDVETQSRRGVGLRIGVEQQHLFSEQGERCREIDGRGGLAHAAFLIC